MCFRSCNIAFIVISAVLTLVGIICFLGGFAASRPDAIKSMTPFFCLGINFQKIV